MKLTARVVDAQTQWQATTPRGVRGGPTHAHWQVIHVVAIPGLAHAHWPIRPVAITVNARGWGEVAIVAAFFCSLP